jgi:hypothetical protein
MNGKSLHMMLLEALGVESIQYVNIPIKKIIKWVVPRHNIIQLSDHVGWDWQVKELHQST